MEATQYIIINMSLVCLFVTLVSCVALEVIACIYAGFNLLRLNKLLKAIDPGASQHFLGLRKGLFILWDVGFIQFLSSNAALALSRKRAALGIICASVIIPFGVFMSLFFMFQR